MLPFTKRPGRAEESSDVVVKDDISAKPAAVAPASASRPNTMRPPPSSSRANDAFDDEMTGLVSSKSLSNSFPPPAPLPGAGRPVSIPPSARSSRGGGSIPPPARSIRPAAGSPASMRPPPSSARNAYEGDDDEDAEDEDGGRTVVRPEDRGGAKPKIRRTASPSMTPAPRSTPSSNPTSISPAAVIRKTMESQRQARGLMTGPPPALRGDLDHDGDDSDDEYKSDEFTQAAPSRSSHGSGARSYQPPPASYDGPPSHRRDERRDEPSYRRRPADSMADDVERDLGRDDSYGARSAPISSPSSSARGHMSHPPPSSARPGHFSNPPSNPAPISTYPSAQNPVLPYQATVPSGHMSSPPPHMSVPPPQHMSMPPQGMMPAHFRMAQTGAIHGVMAAATHVDPPGTAVTSNTRVSGRPAMSWAAALAACGVFVGVVAVAIAQRSDSMSDTQASIVDPAHPAKAPGAPGDPAAPGAPGANPAATQSLPPGLIGASPVQPQTAPPVLPGMMDPQINVAPPATQAPPATAQPQPQQTQPAGGQSGGGQQFAQVSVKKATPAPAAVRPRPAAGGGSKSDDDDEKPKPTAKGKGGKSDADEEQRRALDELRKAQLEQSLGGGK